MTLETSPHQREATLRSELIGAELRKYREAAGWSQSEAGKVIGASLTKMSRIETGGRTHKVEDVAALLAVYRITGHAREDLLARTRSADKKGLLQQEDRSYIERVKTVRSLEDRATVIVNYQPALIPGLLQTVPYAQALMRDVGMALDHDVIEERVAARVARQAVLRKSQAPQFFAILNEEALRNVMGSHAVMGGQLRYLVEAGQRRNICIRVVSQRGQGHPGMEGSFLRFQFENRNDVVYVGGRAFNLFLEDPSEVAVYGKTISRLLTLALPEDESLALISSVADEFAGRND